MKDVDKLTLAEDERLTMLAEECAETIHIICKIKRFGFHSRHPSDINGPTNREKLEIEIGDILGIVTMMYDARDISPSRVNRAWDDKSKRAKPYLKNQP